jgi:hypothetical protein
MLPIPVGLLEIYTVTRNVGGVAVGRPSTFPHRTHAVSAIEFWSVAASQLHAPYAYFRSPLCHAYSSTLIRAASCRATSRNVSA